MKKHLKLAPALLLAFCFVGCGKKANESNKTVSDKSIGPSSAEIYFHGLQDLKKAMANNDLVAFKKVIAENPNFNLNHLLTEGETLLTLAIKNDLQGIRNFLIEKGVGLNKPNVNLETPLIIAVSKSYKSSVLALLDSKADLEVKDGNGDTALHVALKRHNDELALLLIKQGAKINHPDKSGKMPLTIAEEHNVPESLALIRSILDLEYGTPDIASFRTILVQSDYRRLSGLLAHYPQIAYDYAYESINPLAILVDSKDENAAIRSAEILLDYKANVNGPTNSEITPLIKATLAEKKGFLNLYLDAKANPQLLDTEGKSALIHAVELNNPELVESLLSHSAVEKYTFRKNGKKITFNACSVARKTGEKLTDALEKDKNKKIKDQLNCGFFNWLF